MFCGEIEHEQIYRGSLSASLAESGNHTNAARSVSAIRVQSRYAVGHGSMFASSVYLLSTSSVCLQQTCCFTSVTAAATVAYTVVSDSRSD